MEKMDFPSGSAPPALPGSSQLVAKDPLSVPFSFSHLPKEVLLEILARVPCKDLILNCRLVCSQWRDLVDCITMWKRKFEMFKRIKAEMVPFHYHFNPRHVDFYIFGRLERNLIKNPCYEDGIDFWDIGMPLKGRWKIQTFSKEEIQEARWLITDLVNKKYFKTSRGLCTKSQRINLKEHGYWGELIDTCKPRIRVEDIMSSPLNDYRLEVKLLSADDRVLQEFCFLNASFRGTWQKVSHTFRDYPPGVRHIVFQHQGGSDPQHPTKITGSSVLLSRRIYRDTYFDFSNCCDYGFKECAICHYNGDRP